MNPEKRSAIERLSAQSGQTSRNVNLAEFTSIEVRLLERTPDKSEAVAGGPERER
jgi:hypothetical protein